jgi:hypothetical protein
MKGNGKDGLVGLRIDGRPRTLQARPGQLPRTGENQGLFNTEHREVQPQMARFAGATVIGKYIVHRPVFWARHRAQLLPQRRQWQPAGPCTPESSPL